MIATHIDFVFESRKGPFAGIEDADGKPIAIGRWILRVDGRWCLRVDPVFAADRHIGWLIENGESANLVRYRTMHSNGRGWTNDPNAALRFARKVDAEAFRLSDPDAWAVHEYVWIDGESKPRPAGSI